MFFEATFVPSSPSLSDTHSDTCVDELDEPFSDDEQDTGKPVDHLIFVIHGIGQQTEQYGQFYQHIENFQETTRQVLQAKVPDHNVRIELIPIEWHKHIHEHVDPIMKRITLKSIPTIRLIENEYLADVLFYFSKDKGQQIVDNVTHLFNTSYQHFMEKHPYFDGKIIILGYSLGGIITWDILSHQRQLELQEEREMYQKLDINFSKLAFKPDYFFGLGSPISAVLTFRGQDPTWYHPETDIRFENIFHPFDPLGYRFEPLLNDQFTDEPAVLIKRSIPIGPSFSFPSFPIYASLSSFFSWKQEEKVNYEAKEGQQGFMSSLLQYFSKEPVSVAHSVNPDWTKDDVPTSPVDDLLMPRAKSLPRSQTYTESDDTKIRIPLRKSLTDHDLSAKRHHLVEVLGVDGLLMDISQESTEKQTQEISQEISKPEITRPPKDEGNTKNEKITLPGGRRIDYVLQPESVISMIANEYLIGLRAHFSYWTNKDFIWHMLRQVENLDQENLDESDTCLSNSFG